MSYYSEHTQERREYQKRYYHEKQATSAEYKAAKREYIREYQRARRARIKINPTTADEDRRSSGIINDSSPLPERFAART